MSEVREEFFLSQGVITGYTAAEARLQASAAKSFVVENVVSVASNKVDSSSAVVQPEAAVLIPKVTTYKVQLGVFASKKDPAVFKTLTDISNEEVAGKYKYYSGSFATKAEAEKSLKASAKVLFRVPRLIRSSMLRQRTRAPTIASTPIHCARSPPQ